MTQPDVSPAASASQAPTPWYVDVMVAVGLSGTLVFGGFQMLWVLRIVALVIFIGGLYYKTRTALGQPRTTLTLRLGTVLIGFGVCLLVTLLIVSMSSERTWLPWLVFVVLAGVVYGCLVGVDRLALGRRGASRTPDRR